MSYLNRIIMRTKSKNVDSLLPAVLLGEPSGGLGQEGHGKEQEDGGEHLEAPWDTERSGAIDEGAAVGDVEHDKDTPSDGPYLKSDWVCISWTAIVYIAGYQRVCLALMEEQSQ